LEEQAPSLLNPPPRRRSGFGWFGAFLVLALAAGIWAWVAGTDTRVKAIRQTLVPPFFQTLPLGSVKPQGWLQAQMRLQADGLSGHLDEFWPDISQSGWIGGKGEGWERAPYWLDGVIPLAYELGDVQLTRKVTDWVDHILKNQQPDGWLGPNQGASNFGFAPQPLTPRDPWPQFIILKALAQYAEATGDPRVVPAMERDIQNLDRQLDQRPLFEWNYFRWGDFVATLDWLYDRTGENWIPPLEAKVAAQGYDWSRHFRSLPEKGKTREWNFFSHGVNNAMGLKVPALLYRLTGRGVFKRLALAAPRTLDRYHGQANGLFSADECLAGKSPSQGTELCAVVEEMYSLETDLSVLGDPAFADRVEKIAFNALPAAFTPDYWRHQYDQQANQVACVFSNDPVYTTNRGSANLFGLEPQYGCCTANFHQGWPKFTSHLWMKSRDGGLVAALYAPSVVETHLGGAPVRVELATDYPFSEVLTFNLDCPQGADFPLYLRVPAWAKDATLRLPDGTLQLLGSGRYVKVQRHWQGKETMILRLPMAFHLRAGFQKAMSVEHGPLVFSLGLKEEWHPGLPFRFQPKGKKMTDLMGVPLEPWNWALALDGARPENSLAFESGPLKGNPFTLEGAPVTVKAKGRLLADWIFERGAAQPPPESPVESLSSLQDLVLVPYGSTRLRVTEFPVLR